MLDKLERKLGRYAIPNLVTFLVGGQAVSFVLSQTRPDFAEKLALVPAKVLEGEAWRLVSFLFVHPTNSLIGIIFLLMLIYSFGQALEAFWGAFRFNVYLLLVWAGSVGAAFVAPSAPATNLYLLLSALMAFCYLAPEHEVRLMFVFPVKMKWVGAVVGLAFVYWLVTGDLQTRALVAAALSSFVLFFGRDVWLRVRGRARTHARRAEEARAAGTPHHRCAVCGDTDLTAPNKQFRYCSQCGGKRAYCMDHLRNHEHVGE